MESPQNQPEICINQSQLDWLCDQTFKLNEKNEDLRNMFMEHILKLTNNYISIVENINENKSKNETNKSIEDLNKIVSKFKQENSNLIHENTNLICENKSLKYKLFKYTNEHSRDIPKELIRLVNINPKTDIKVCKNIIYQGKCDAKLCPYWHNYNEAYKWSVEVEKIKKHIRDHHKELGEIERPRNYKRPREENYTSYQRK